MHHAARHFSSSNCTGAHRAGSGTCLLMLYPPMGPAESATRNMSNSQRRVMRRSAALAGDSSMDDSEQAVQVSKPIRAVNELTKWTVSAAAAYILIARRDFAVMWCILGSLVNVVFCKALKKLIKAQRPAGSLSQGHGMPSSHAQSLSYLSVCAAAGILSSQLAHPWKHISAGAVLALGLFMTWLRVASHCHTVPQVSVGYVLGAGMALTWHCWGLSHAVAYAGQQPWLTPAVYTLCIAASIAFATKSILRSSTDLHRFKKIMGP